MTSPRLLALASLLALSAPAAAGESSIVLPAGAETSPGNSSTLWPFASSQQSERAQWAYDPSLFPSSGPILITGISIRANQNNLGLDSFCFPSIEVTMATGSMPVSLISNQDYDANLGPDATVVRPGAPLKSDGIPPATSPPFVSPWVPLECTAPFVFDPSTAASFVVDLKVCGQTKAWSQGMDGFSVSGSKGKTILNLQSCAALTGGSTLTGFLPVIKLDVASTEPQWQVNSPEAHLDVDGGTNTPLSPLRVKRLVNQLFTVNWKSTLAGNAYVVVISPARAVGGLSGGSETGGGQFVNVNLALPTVTVTGVVGAPVAIPSMIGTTLPPATLQMFVADPTHADGYRASAACEIEIVDGC